MAKIIQLNAAVTVFERKNNRFIELKTLAYTGDAVETCILAGALEECDGYAYVVVRMRDGSYNLNTEEYPGGPEITEYKIKLNKA